MKYAAALFSIVLISMCVQTTNVGGGLKFDLQADPASVFSGNTVRMTMDLENNNPRKITDVQYEIFDTGRLNILETDGARCNDAIPFVMPGEFKTGYCYLEAPQMEDDRADTEVNARAYYQTDFSAVQVVEMLDEQEYIRRQSQGALVSKGDKFSYSDDNIQVDIEFSEPLPILVRDKEYYIYFTVHNKGNGFISSLDADSFVIKPAIPSGPEILDCSNSIGQYGWHIEPIGRDFPRIACRLILPKGVKVVENYGLLININYGYEVRKSARITLIK